MRTHQAMKLLMLATVTGVVHRHAPVNCELSAVQLGVQNQVILEGLQSRRCQHLQSLVVQGRQESGQRRLRRSQGTLMLMYHCSRGK